MTIEQKSKLINKLEDTFQYAESIEEYDICGIISCMQAAIVHDNGKKLELYVRQYSKQLLKELSSE